MSKAKRVPKGWSEYQAAWIPDDDAEFQQDEDDESDGHGSDEEFMDARSEENSFYSDAEGEDRDFDTVTESGMTIIQLFRQKRHHMSVFFLAHHLVVNRNKSSYQDYFQKKKWLEKHHYC